MFIPSMGFCLAVSELLCEDLQAFWRDLGRELYDPPSDVFAHEQEDDSTQRNDSPNREQDKVKGTGKKRRKNYKAISSLHLLLLPLLLIFTVRIVSR